MSLHCYKSKIIIIRQDKKCFFCLFSTLESFTPNWSKSVTCASHSRAFAKRADFG
jgi:hypothetical protein